jgi:hypothetical protein
MYEWGISQVNPRFGRRTPPCKSTLHDIVYEASHTQVCLPARYLCVHIPSSRYMSYLTGARCGYPVKTGSLPLSYSGNPGVNAVSHRGGGGCNNVPGRPCIYMGRPVVNAVSHREGARALGAVRGTPCQEGVWRCRWAQHIALPVTPSKLSIYPWIHTVIQG